MKVLIEEVSESLLLARRKRNDTTERRSGAFLQINLEIVRPVLREHVGLYFIEDISEFLIFSRNVISRCRGLGIV